MTGTLAAEGLALDRGSSLVLASVSAALQPGMVTAICGPNGAGKSSLMLGLAGLLHPSDGQATLSGKAVHTIPAAQRARAIGYLPQSADVAWDVSVESLVALGRHPHGDAGGENGRKAIAAAIHAAQLDDLRHRPVTQLSGGERARALLARVLAGQPDWILADEPLAALDMAHQIALVGHLGDCAAKGAGVVVVLHDLAIAMNHADRVLVLGARGEQGGELVADGPPPDALSSDVISKVWGVEGEWIGSAGRRAFLL
ncbi:MAG: ABC transporter ATP-binding protein [Pseudomonadota bacterium]|nr:ABC transporter ATP-binding protein [Pseudomonadota bacterium]